MENAEDINYPFDKDVIYPSRWKDQKIIVTINDKNIVFGDSIPEHYNGLKQSEVNNVIYIRENNDWKRYNRTNTDRDMAIPNVNFDKNKIYNALYLKGDIEVYINDKTVRLPKLLPPDHYLGLQITTDMPTEGPATNARKTLIVEKSIDPNPPNAIVNIWRPVKNIKLAGPSRVTPGFIAIAVLCVLVSIVLLVIGANFYGTSKDIDLRGGRYYDSIKPSTLLFLASGVFCFMPFVLYFI